MKLSAPMRAWLGGLGLALLLLCSLSRVHAQASVAPAPLLVVELGDGAQELTARLAELIERPLAVVQVEADAPIERASSLARQRGLPHALIIDPRGGTVHALRVSDATVLSRTIAPARDTPFAIAFVASELVQLLEGLGRPPPAALPTHKLELTLGLGLDALLLAPYVGALRPALGIALARALPDRALELELAALVALLGKVEQRTAAGEVTLTRSDLALRAGAKLRLSPLRVGLFGQLGLTLVRAELANQSSEQHRRAGSLGLAGELALRLFGPLSAHIVGALTANLPRADYRVYGMTVLRDGALSFALELGLAYRFRGS